jgi:hypothetical protein
MRYMRIYRLLKRQGHSPSKAVEILLDAKRGQEHALNWIGICFKQRR